MPVGVDIPDADGRELAAFLAYLLETWHLLAEPPSRIIRPERQRIVWTAWVEMLESTAGRLGLATAPLPGTPAAPGVAPAAPLTVSGLLHDVRRALHPGRPDREAIEALFVSIGQAVVEQIVQHQAMDQHGLRGDQRRAKTEAAWGYLYALRALGDPNAYAPSDLGSHQRYVHAVREAYESFRPVLGSILSAVPGGGAIGEAVDLVEGAVKSGADLAADVRNVMAGRGFRT